ncbi:hypothetical protein BDY19DRAFT_996858 [Irpex rosettiformis]|uniref:Uncharacterized protein n=1 Tax=Irpex rosettiformis TaxID=378272 RepID=A0ACB8TTG8_9APHY|nr:hypothetical protein BDY19DRAFT_996858 [Irpex rosettiformis]
MFSMRRQIQYVTSCLHTNTLSPQPPLRLLTPPKQATSQTTTPHSAHPPRLLYPLPYAKDGTQSVFIAPDPPTLVPPHRFRIRLLPLLHRSIPIQTARLAGSRVLSIIKLDPMPTWIS